MCSFHIGQAARLTAYGVDSSTYHSKWDKTPFERAASAAESQRENLDRFRYHSAGLWPFAALLNHSCLPNAERSNIGDMLILRAAVDMPAGAEVTIAYLTSGQFIPERLRANWGIDCRCPVCDDVRLTPPDVRARRDAALAGAVAAVAAAETLRVPYTSTPGSQVPARHRALWAKRLQDADASVKRAAQAFGFPASDTAAAAAAAAAAAVATGAASEASGWVPQRRLADVLHNMSNEYVYWAMTAPVPGPAATAWMRAYADTSATYVMDSLRALGYIIRESGARWPDDHARRGVAAGGGGGVAAPMTGAARRRARRALKQQQQEQQQQQLEAAAPVSAPLVVEKWGTSSTGVGPLWFSLLRAYLIGGAHAELVDVAKGYARTHYRISVGEDVTFERQYDELMSIYMQVGELHRENW
jgi:hypothetical protein